MLIHVRHVLIGCAAAAAAALGTLLVYVILRHGGGVEAVVRDLDLVALGVGLAGLGSAGVGLWAWWRVRSHVRALAEHLSAVRHNPSRAAFDAGRFSDAQIEALGPLYREAAALSTSYRQAIAERVKHRAALASFHARSGVEERPGRLLHLSHRPPGASRNMVGRLTPNLRWLSATPALLKLLGRNLFEINGRAFAESLHPEHLAGLEAQFQEILNTGEGHHLVFRVLVRRRRVPPKGGPRRLVTEVRYVQMDALTRCDEEGRPQHIRCYFEDISARMRAEHKLRRRTAELSETNEQLLRINRDLERLKESYRDLYHNAPIMFFSLDARGQFVACNDTMVQALGYRREDLSEQPYARLLPPEAAETWEAALVPDAAGARPHALMADRDVEVQWAKRDGTVIDVWIRSLPVTDEEGRFLRSRSAAQDITQRKRLSEEVRRRRDDLERANADLERANAELQVINKELDVFTSTVAHDLKEPLRTLEGYSNILAEDFSTQLGPDGFECINHMLTASRRLKNRIDDLLRLSRAGRIATAPRVFHLNEAMAVVRRDLGDMIQRRNAVLLTEGSLPAVVGDLERVTQLLANLVANGLKYNTQAQPAVTVGALDGEAGAEFATIFVRDNGIGIDPCFHQDIFRIFRRLHHQEEYEGTGAGLAICKRIIQAHNGKIWVESQPGDGATFYFTLPVPSGDAAATRPAVAAPAAPPALVASPLQAAAARLLLVEDMEDMGLIVQRLARKAGHEIHWVTSAEAAWEYLKDHQPELVLLDIHLPGMDGVELCRRLRALPQQAGLPIALFSQGAHREDITAGLEAGANFVLPKDLLCQPDAWRRRLHEVLAQTRGQKAEDRRQKAEGSGQEGEVTETVLSAGRDS
jgi:PAS domain S-box-containing protein